MSQIFSIFVAASKQPRCASGAKAKPCLIKRQKSVNKRNICDVVTLSKVDVCRNTAGMAFKSGG